MVRNELHQLHLSLVIRKLRHDSTFVQYKFTCLNWEMFNFLIYYLWLTNHMSWKNKICYVICLTHSDSTTHSKRVIPVTGVCEYNYWKYNTGLDSKQIQGILLHNIQPGHAIHPKTSVEWMPGSLSQVIKQPECKAIQTSSSNVTGKNECRCTWSCTVYLRFLRRDHMTSSCISPLNFLSHFHYTECNATVLYLCRFRELV